MDEQSNLPQDPTTSAVVSESFDKNKVPTYMNYVPIIGIFALLASRKSPKQLLRSTRYLLAIILQLVLVGAVIVIGVTLLNNKNKTSKQPQKVNSTKIKSVSSTDILAFPCLKPEELSTLGKGNGATPLMEGVTYGYNMFFKAGNPVSLKDSLEKDQFAKIESLEAFSMMYPERNYTLQIYSVVQKDKNAETVKKAKQFAEERMSLIRTYLTTKGISISRITQQPAQEFDPASVPAAQKDKLDAFVRTVYLRIKVGDVCVRT